LLAQLRDFGVRDLLEAKEMAEHVVNDDYSPYHSEDEDEDDLVSFSFNGQAAR
jgi:hypothetical protein